MTTSGPTKEPWIAGLLEYRVALAIAATASIALVTMLVITPSGEMPGHTSVSASSASKQGMSTQTASTQHSQQAAPRYSIPDTSNARRDVPPPAPAIKAITPDTPSSPPSGSVKQKAKTSVKAASEAKPVIKQVTKPIAKAAVSSPAASAQRSISKPAAGTSTHVYFVQVGAYRERSSAQQQAATLMQKGWNSVVSSNTGNGLFVVRIGPASTRGAADKLRDQLLNKAKLKGFVVSE